MLFRAGYATLSVMESPNNRSVNTFEEDRLELIKRCIIPAVALTLALAIGISALCLSAGYINVFQNLFYLPILIVTICYPGAGLPFATFCSAVYFTLIFLVFGYRSEIVAILTRIAFFELITGVVAYMAMKLKDTENALKNQLANLGTIVQEQTDYISRELEESHRLENAYRRATVYHEMIMGQAGAAIVIWNPEQYITGVNPVLCQYLGMDESDLVGRKITSILPLEESGIYAYPVRIETMVRSGDGALKRGIWVVSEIRETGQDKPLAYMSIGQEVPERKI